MNKGGTMEFLYEYLHCSDILQRLYISNLIINIRKEGPAEWLK
jgi:hypothetical protein